MVMRRSKFFFFHLNSLILSMETKINRNCCKPFQVSQLVKVNIGNFMDFSNFTLSLGVFFLKIQAKSKSF